MLTKGLTLKPELTAARLRELLHYDPETGVFVRLNSMRSDRIGKQATGLHSKGYARIFVEDRKHYAHRLAWLYVHGKWPDGDIDHINHDKTDNRIENLRDVSRSTNAENLIGAKSHNRSSGLLGVSWHKAAAKWSASIQTEGVPRHLGLFQTKREAHDAYLKAKRSLHQGCTI